jgi:5-dehydro-4-deoxyglucarate dehydratase
MSRYTPKEFAQQIGSGLLSFPITHFKASDLSFDEDAYRKNLAWLFSHAHRCRNGPRCARCRG